MNTRDLLQWPCIQLLSERPYVRDFFSACGLPAITPRQTVAEVLDALEADRLAALGMDRATVIDRFVAFVDTMQHLKADRDTGIHSVTVLGGHDKDGRPEDVR
ncbi:hypothetical protein, partial [Desulfosarcina cetonica]|uniref:hypothetical protein n=1 Tax=Desulfosarcina cetonica TaxID=90730 RepID=UPI000AD59776